MASSTVVVPRHGQQTKSGQQQNALDNGHSLPPADGSPSTRHGPSSEAKAEEKGKISGLEMKSAGTVTTIVCIISRYPCDKTFNKSKVSNILQNNLSCSV